ncbi:MAG: RNA pyrophosphohydrolase [Sulfurospirillaceae bacterium]|nr:RNA pyrophosphohydrolase [Sulfurospirillaceae bacterium]
MSENKKYRQNVAAVILSHKYPLVCELFVARRNDMKNVWQFPQGGIDDGESEKDALFRELEEEIGTNKIEIITKYPEQLKYDFPQTIAKKMYPFDGQNQTYFLVKLKSSAKIDLNTKHPEFDDYNFVKLEKIFEMVTYFKRPVYQKVLSYFKKEGYL